MELGSFKLWFKQAKCSFRGVEGVSAYNACKMSNVRNCNALALALELEKQIQIPRLSPLQVP